MTSAGFVDAFVAEQCALAAKGARVSGNGFAACASSQLLPDGNHGENVLQGATP